MSVWLIKRSESLCTEVVGELPGVMKDIEVERVLQRLACMTLNANEIIAASLRRKQEGRSSLLDRIGRGYPIQIGENPFFTAEWIE